MSYWNGHSEGMSSAFHVANIVESRMANEMHQNAAEWEQYANGLQAKLNGLEAKLEESDAKHTLAVGFANGRKDAILALQEALRAKDPNHALLSEDAIRKFEDRELTQYASTKGWNYNPASRSVRRAE